LAKKVVHTLISIQPGSEVIYLDDFLNVLFHIESVGASGITEYSYEYSDDRIITIYIHHLLYKWTSLKEVFLGKKDGQIQVFQIPDDVYYNP
jgi:hypothetical protein